MIVTALFDLPIRVFIYSYFGGMLGELLGGSLGGLLGSLLGGAFAISILLPNKTPFWASVCTSLGRFLDELIGSLFIGLILGLSLFQLQLKRV